MLPVGHEEVALLWLRGAEPPKRGSLLCSGCVLQLLGDNTHKNVDLKSLQPLRLSKTGWFLARKDVSLTQDPGLLQAVLLWKDSDVSASLRPAALALLL